MVHFVRLRQGLWSLEKPVVLGILNATPDSFYADGRALAEEACVKADSLIKDGADWVDVGGCSTRPGSTPPTEEEEWQRIAPVLDYLAKNHPTVPVSVDTYRASVAQRALDEGASLINDVSSGLWDPKMVPLVAASQVPYIAMHHQGRPNSMQLAPQYTHVVQEVFGFFAQQVGCGRHFFRNCRFSAQSSNHQILGCLLRTLGFWWRRRLGFSTVGRALGAKWTPVLRPKPPPHPLPPLVHM